MLSIREFDPAGPQVRNPLTRHTAAPRAQHPTSDGPDHKWSVDGHDKLSRWGFQIYAAIDVYSRKYIFMYCGNANRSSIAVLWCYLQAVKRFYRCPKALHMDCESETFLIAAVHYSFFVAALAAAHTETGEEGEVNAENINIK